MASPSATCMLLLFVHINVTYNLDTRFVSWCSHLPLACSSYIPDMSWPS